VKSQETPQSILMSQKKSVSSSKRTRQSSAQREREQRNEQHKKIEELNAFLVAECKKMLTLK
jgi:hypothetical protein